MSVGGSELQAIQNNGDGSHTFELPQTTFDDGSRIRRLEDGGSLVGEAYFGARSILRLAELRHGPGDVTSFVRLRRALGGVSTKFAGAHEQAEDIAWLN